MLAIQKKSIAVVAFLAGVIGLVGTAYAKEYPIVFAGKTIVVDCPSSPEGQTLTWVNQNCTYVSSSISSGQPVKLKDQRK